MNTFEFDEDGYVESSVDDADVSGSEIRDFERLFKEAYSGPLLPFEERDRAGAALDSNGGLRLVAAAAAVIALVVGVAVLGPFGGEPTEVIFADDPDGAEQVPGDDGATTSTAVASTVTTTATTTTAPSDDRSTTTEEEASVDADSPGERTPPVDNAEPGSDGTSATSGATSDTETPSEEAQSAETTPQVSTTAPTTAPVAPATTTSVPEGDPPPAPNNIGCTFLDGANVEWSWTTLPSLVDDYVVALADGSRVSVGDQPGPYVTTDGAPVAIIAVRDGIESATDIGPCSDWRGTPPTAENPEAPTNVTCEFHDFFFDDTNTYTWSETWWWADDPSVDEYRVRLDVDGVVTVVPADNRGIHTTVGTKGAPGVGTGLTGIIAVRDGLTNERAISTCGSLGGTGWEPPPNQ